MPKSFLKCIEKGGRVRTVKPSQSTYLHVCYLGGKSYRGEVKRTGASKRKK